MGLIPGCRCIAGCHCREGHDHPDGGIVHGLPATTNVAFGGDDWKTLYFTTRSSLNMVTVKIAGVPVPARKRTS